ncbi:transposase-like protein [Bradyrhizobium ottawaense]|uniref:Transposase-like protein n=1 Tax=Bradyrhizobium ottawaense TaxID=931866 RepID=A0ABV4FHX7_9BRAD
MRYPASEKAEIIQLVEQSHLSVSRAPHSIAGMIATAREALKRWPITGLDQTGSGIAPRRCAGSGHRPGDGVT